MSQQTQLKQIAKRGSGPSPPNALTTQIITQTPSQHQPVTVPLNLIGSSSTVEQRLLANVNTSISQIQQQQQQQQQIQSGSTAPSQTIVSQSRPSLLVPSSTIPFSANSSSLQNKGIMHQHSLSKELTQSSTNNNTAVRRSEISALSAQKKGGPMKQLSAAKTPQMGSLNLQNTDYYSVQSNGSSRNMSNTQAQTAGGVPKKSNLNHTSNSQSAIRQSISSRNAAMPNYTMIKSSNIVVTSSGTGGKPYIHEGRYKNMLNYAAHVGGSPQYKGSRTSITGSQSNLGVPAVVQEKDQSMMTMVPVPMVQEPKTIQRGSIDKRYKATSQERLRQRQQSNEPQQILYSNHRSNTNNLIYQATYKHQNSGPQNRRTSTIGASPMHMTLCAQHQKPPTVFSPSKQQLSIQKSTVVILQSQQRQGNHSTPITFEIASDVALKSQSQVQQPTQQKETPTSSIIQYSPKHPGGSVSVGGTNLKSPVGQKKLITQPAPLSSVLSSGSGSPQPPQNRHNLATKGITSRLSAGGTNNYSNMESFSHKKSQRSGQSQQSLSYQQTSRIIHSKVVKNLNNNSPYQVGSTPDNCLKIDLNQINNTAKNQTAALSYTAIIEQDQEDQFLIYGASGDVLHLNNIQIGKKGPIIQNNQQPMLAQFKSPSPNATATQFFAKSPKMSTSKLNPPSSSSNRHSLLITNTQTTPQHTSNPNTQRQQTTMIPSTFNQQTKSSIAKANKVPQKVAQETQQAMVQKSKTQRMMNPSKYTYQKNYLQSKVTTTRFEVSGQKPALTTAVNQRQVFEIVPAPQQILEVSQTLERTEEKKNEIEISVVPVMTAIVGSPQRMIVSVTPMKFIDESGIMECNNEQDISPPKDSNNNPDQTTYYTPPHETPASLKYPMDNHIFVNKYKELLTPELITEIEKFPIIYVPGLVLTKTEEIEETSQEAEPHLPTPIKTLEEFKTKKSIYDDEDGYYKIRIGDQLLYRYEIIKILGKGSFAQVVQCKDHTQQDKMIAIKVTRNTELDHKFAQSEAKLLQYLMQHDPSDEFNIVRLYDEFVFREHHCFVFELLPKGDLFEHLKASGFTGFPLTTIKQYAREILKALVFLEQHRVIHCDLKPENMLLIAGEAGKPNRLKLVDFGSGSFRGEQVYTYVQSRFYRAPEVILRLLPPPTSYSEKVDIWSLGCILAELFTGEPLFPGNNEQEQLELIMEICGIPPNSFIDRCRKKEHYFDTDYSPFLIEDEEQGILRIPESKRLEQIIVSDDTGFVDFIRKCLELDPDTRFSATQAIQHPWIRDETVVGVKAEWGQLNQLRDHSISQDEVFNQGRGLTAPNDADEDMEAINLTREEMRNSARQQLVIQENDDNNGMIMMSASSSQVAFINATNSLRRRDEDMESGVRGTQFEESPVRDPALERPKKTLAKHQSQFTMKPVNEEQLMIAEIENRRVQVLIDLSPCRMLEEIDSNMSSPKNEGGIQQNLLPPPAERQNYLNKNLDTEESKQDHFLLIPMENSALDISHEKRRDRSARKKAHEVVEQAKTPTKGNLIVQKQTSPSWSTGRDHIYQGQKLEGSKQIQMIGQYEIFRNEDSMTPESRIDLSRTPLAMSEVRESVTSGIAIEANIPPVNHQPGTDSVPSTGGIQSENTINKITITFYQKRGGAGASDAQKITTGGPLKKK